MNENLFRYVDDIAMAVPSNSIDDILNISNSFHPKLQFILEIGEKNLNFFDITMIIIGKIFEFFISTPSLPKKRGIIINMVDRAFLLSHPRFHHVNLRKIINILLDDDYSLKFIFDTIDTRLKYLISQHGQQKIVENSKDIVKK